ncbi:hypothetical protein OGATHE_003454 [Ogataea polymorpha]|uniref:Uncharacterized protein n=1 Tax=Ogataea polymorpha TaxID=460523 RepID=A0A9P8T3X4_9ASCO|nr:hypothetical protein OGATHE_003454 [Ogataea polymorpha]
MLFTREAMYPEPLLVSSFSSLLLLRASWKASKSVIHSVTNLESLTSVLLNTTIIGSLVLYRMEQAYSMLEMNVVGDELLGVSMMYAIIVGKVDAKASVMMAPDADHMKHSICPGVSTMQCLNLSDFFSTREMTWSILVENKFKDVTIAPLGPRL